jgi:APA family basic amino acid/polyamine antiporter
LFSSDAWNNVTFIAGGLGTKEYTTKFISVLIVTVIYILANLLIWLFYPCMTRASDIAGNGIMFASNDRVGAAAAV